MPRFAFSADESKCHYLRLYKNIHAYQSLLLSLHTAAWLLLFGQISDSSRFHRCMQAFCGWVQAWQTCMAGKMWLVTLSFLGPESRGGVSMNAEHSFGLVFSTTLDFDRLLLPYCRCICRFSLSRGTCTIEGIASASFRGLVKQYGSHTSQSPTRRERPSLYKPRDLSAGLLSASSPSKTCRRYG